MLKHILTTFYRSALLSRFQMITIVFGLTMGMVVSLLIYIYVMEESNYDRHHADTGRIFRINTTLEMEGKVDPTAKAAYNTGEALMEFYPEVQSFTQLLNVSKQTIKVRTELFSSEKVVYADSNLFTFFTYPFVKGEPEIALDGPNKAVISRSVALQYFGSEAKAMDGVMNINNVDFLVTGIYDERVNRTHIPYDIFLSLSSLPQDFLRQRNREYMWLTTYNYLLLKRGVDQHEFRGKLKAFHEKRLVPYVQKNEVNGAITFNIEPVTDIHLSTKLRFDFAGATNPDYLTIFSGVAILTLFIALINYINLTTARVSRRLKEIGIKKSIGATKSSLLFQFLVETIIIVAGSYAIALVLLYFSIPELNKLTEKSFSFDQIITPSFLAVSVTFILSFGLMAGAYPSMLLSSFRPIQALQATQKVIGTSLVQKLINPGFIRKVLVTVQFSISVFLIIGTIVIFRQFEYMKGQDMGFDQEQVMVIDIPNDTAVSNKIEVIKNALLEIPSIKSVSAASSIPGSGHGALTMNVSQSGGSEIKVLNTYFADDKFIETLDIDLAKGRFFSREFSTDPQQAFVINEAAVKFLGWEDQPLDKKIISPFGQDGKVVGVIKDFNYKSLHSSIEPLVLMNTPNSQGYLLIKIMAADLFRTIEQVGESWKAFDDAHPYEYFFLDEKFQAQYVKEERLTKIFTYFSAVAILISCLGLIGLAIYTNEMKTREIAIRKTLGASRMQVLELLSKEFLLLILLANFIAWPVSYFMISDWLSDFAYQTELDVIPFLSGMGIALLIALLTITYFANRAARQSIVRALKYD
jgi:putative ABC transport system permease protein